MTQAIARVQYDPAQGGLGMERVAVIACDGGGRPVADVRIIFTVAEGAGFVGDGEDTVEYARTNAEGVAAVYWFSVPERRDDVGQLREAIIHARCDEPGVETLRLQSAPPGPSAS